MDITPKTKSRELHKSVSQFLADTVAALPILNGQYDRIEAHKEDSNCGTDHLFESILKATSNPAGNVSPSDNVKNTTLQIKSKSNHGGMCKDFVIKTVMKKKTGMKLVIRKIMVQTFLNLIFLNQLQIGL